MHRQTKHTNIPKKVKDIVWERDNHRCVICGCRYGAFPDSHIIPRSKGGLGIPKNIVTMCRGPGSRSCHDLYDNGDRETRETFYLMIERYMKEIYLDWDTVQKTYKKWRFEDAE